MAKETSKRLQTNPKAASKIKHARKETDSQFYERLGRRYADELLTRHTVVEDIHPDEAKLRKWFSGDTVGKKFSPWWHQAIADLKDWHFPVSPVWDIIIACLDTLFPGTSNKFSPYDCRPHVQERELFAYLSKKHHLSKRQARKLTLIELATILQQDCRPPVALANKPARKRGALSKIDRDRAWLREFEEEPRKWATMEAAAKAKHEDPDTYRKALARARDSREAAEQTGNKLSP